MNEQELAIWKRIEQFPIDEPGAPFPLSARLAREQGWTKDFTQRVMLEYRRYCFLAAVSDHPVSPSEVVDEAWHIHLLYTDNYWRRFCPDALGKPFHHFPTLGGTTEKGKFDDWYSTTLQSYERYFGKKPPRDIWPEPGYQFAYKPQPITKDTHWIIRKPKLRFRLPLVLGGILAALGLSGCGPTIAQVNPFDMRGPDFLGFYVVFAAVTYITALLVRASSIKPMDGPSAMQLNLSPVHIAYLHGGKVLALNAILTNMIGRGALEVDSKMRILRPKDSTVAADLPFEQAIMREVGSGMTFAQLRDQMSFKLDQIEDDLRNMGLYVPWKNYNRAMIWPLLLSLSAPAVGVIKITVGISRHRPVEYLVILCILTFLLCLATFLRVPNRSPYGEQVLGELRHMHWDKRRVDPAHAGMSVALFGLEALIGTPLADYRHSLQPPPGSSGCGSSTSGCSSSDSGGGGGDGGGCGGGCGGCGGCGG